MSFAGLFFGIIFALVERCIFGYITVTINENKGYDGGFLWGFFLGVLGILIVGVRGDNYVYVNEKEEYLISKQAEKERNEDMINNGGWKCSKCGKVNPSYTGTCSCGTDKYASQREIREAKLTKEQNQHELQIIDIIKKYKELLDMGAITQEQFDAKKEELLKR